jgi:hypothetical protein
MRCRMTAYKLLPACSESWKASKSQKMGIRSGGKMYAPHRLDVRQCLLQISSFLIRNTPNASQMPESWDEIIAAVSARTIHVACLPFMANLETIGECFRKYGTVNQVRLLKYFSQMPEHKMFRGTALVEFGSREEAQAVLGNTVEFDGCAVRLQTKADYEAAVKEVCLHLRY